MKRLLQGTVAIVSIGYPFLVYWGLQRYDARILLPLLLGFLALRWFTSQKKSDRQIAIGSVVAVLLLSLVWDFTVSLKSYPVIMNLGFLIVFASSLFSPPPMIERFARIRNPHLGPSEVAYTRKVTWVWCVFFVFNGSLAAITAIWASEEIWVLYNGFICYLLIGSLFVGEWLVRRRVMNF